jgi:hypothetical protein
VRTEEDPKNNDVELLSKKDMKVDNSKNIKQYEKYEEAIDRIKLIDWVKEQIRNKSDKKIVVKFKEVAKELGFENKSYSTLFQALKVIFFNNGIFINMGTYKDGDKIFILRELRPGEKIPSSYLSTKERKGGKEKIKSLRKRKKLKKGRLHISKEKYKELYEQKENLLRENNKLREIESRQDHLLQTIIKDRDTILEDAKKEKLQYSTEIKKLNQILNDRIGKEYMVEIFLFNWENLTWRIFKRKSVKTYNKLIDIILENVSSNKSRFRLELTPTTELIKNEETEMEGEKMEEQKGAGAKETGAKATKVEEAKEEKVEKEINLPAE